MTIISTAKVITPMDLGEGSLDLGSPDDNYKAFPPISDTIVWFKQVDWADVRRRCRAGLNNVGLVLAVAGEKIHDFGCYLAEV